MRIKYALSLLVLLITAFFIACEDDSSFDELANSGRDNEFLRDSLERERLRLQFLQDSLDRVAMQQANLLDYTVLVLDCSGNNQPVSGATVTIIADSIERSVSSNALGFAHFSGIRGGIIAGRISSSEITDVSFIVDLNLSEEENRNNVSTLIPVFSLNPNNMATISGTGTIELDLTNTSPENAENAMVSIQILTEDQRFMDRFINNSTDSSSSTQLLGLQYEGLFSRAQFDANGAFQINVPAATKGLPLSISFSDVEANQLMAINNFIGEESSPRIESVPALFGEAFTPSENIPDDINPIQTTIENPPPGGNGAVLNLALRATNIFGLAPGQPIVQGVHYVVENGGEGYSPNSEIPISISIENFVGNTENAGQALLRARTDANGSVESLVVLNDGFGYRGNSALTVLGSGTGAEIRILYGSELAQVGDISIAAEGSSFVSRGTSYYIPPDAILFGEAIDESGQVFNVNQEFFDAFEVENGQLLDQSPIFSTGTRFTTIPELIVRSNAPNAATATTTSANGTINVPLIQQQGLGYINDQPPLVNVIDLLGSGSGAELRAIIQDTQLQEIIVTNPGAGYSERTSTNFVTTGIPFQIVGAEEIEALPGSSYLIEVHYGTGFRSAQLE